MATPITKIHSADEPTARVAENTLILDGFRDRDPQVVALVRDADDPEEVVHDCLAVGARALGAAKTTMEVALVEKAFDDMSGVFTRGLEKFAGEIDTTAKELLDGEEGTLR